MSPKIVLAILFIYLPSILYGKDLYGRYKYLSIGPKNGICFGTPKDYNGIRLNLWDKKKAEINGLSISGFSENKKTNGITLGIVGTKDDVLNGIELSALLAKSSNSNGIKIGGLTCEGRNHNGLVLSSLYISGKKNSGMGISGGEIDTETLNGFFIGLFLGSPKKRPVKVINGVGIGGIGVHPVEMNGFSLCGWISSNCYQKGVSIAPFNFSDELHGFQFGLLNFAWNNRPIFRMMPIVNFHLKKKNKR